MKSEGGSGEGVGRREGGRIGGRRVKGMWVGIHRYHVPFICIPHPIGWCH